MEQLDISTSPLPEEWVLPDVPEDLILPGQPEEPMAILTDQPETKEEPNEVLPTPIKQDVSRTLDMEISESTTDPAAPIKIWSSPNGDNMESELTQHPWKFASEIVEPESSTSTRSRPISTMYPPIFLPTRQLELCWNCGYPDHKRSACYRPQRLFCSKCGKVGVMSTNCCKSTSSRVVRTQQTRSHRLQPTRGRRTTEGTTRRSTATQCNLIYVAEDGTARFQNLRNRRPAE